MKCSKQKLRKLVAINRAIFVQIDALKQLLELCIAESSTLELLATLTKQIQNTMQVKHTDQQEVARQAYLASPLS